MKNRAEIDLRDRLSLEATACLTIRRPDEACTACADVCPAQAIAIGERAVELDHDRCTGCARCVAACPTGALALPLPLAWTDAALTLECSRVVKADRSPDAQIVPCLGGISSAQMLETLLHGGRATLVNRGWCSDCPAGGCAEPWSKAVLSAQADLAQLGANVDMLRILSVPTPPEQAQVAPQPRRPRQQGYSRRQLFRRLTSPAPAPDLSRVTTAQPFSGKVDVTALKARREVLRLLHGAGTLPAALFPALECSGTPDMRLAASLCPTEALSLREAPEADALIFDAALCLACGDCEKADGLHVRPQGEGLYQGAVTLARQAMADCPRCLRRFAPRAGQRTCDACHKDTDLAASAFGLMRRAQAPYGA